MKPKILKITGINSFNEEQIINFSNLLSKGIFGIFGDTGSGKSTIIDCITLALYGKIVRHRNKNGDFININRNDAKVEFEFSIKDGKIRKNYYILRQFKREKEGNITSKVARLIDIEKNEILADKIKDIQTEIENIIGLNYEDFIKAVILPQGKFSEFLMLENAEKRKMLERIFGLEKYGEKLNKKINDKKKEKKEELDKIDEQISIYSEITEDDLKEKISLIEKNNNFLRTNKKELEKILKEIAILEKSIELKEKYIENFEKQKELFRYKQMVEDFKTELENSKKCNIIKPFLIEILDIRKNKDEIEKNFFELERKNKDLEAKYLEQEEKYKSISFKLKNEIPKLNEETIYLKGLIDLESECKNTELEIFNINKEILEINTKYNTIKNKKKNLEEEKNKLEKNIEDLQIFKEENKIDNFLKENLKKAIDIKINVKEKENIIKDTKKDIEEEKNKLEKNNVAINRLEEEKIYILITNKLDLQNKLKNSLKKEKSILEKIEEIKQKIYSIDNSLKLQQNEEFAKSLVEKLEEGLPCPICGSQNHPSPAKIFLKTMAKTLEQEKINFNKDIEKLDIEKIHILKKQAIYNKNLEILENELGNFNIENFEKKIIDTYIFENLDEVLRKKNNDILNLKHENIIFKTNIKNKQETIFLQEQQIKNFKEIQKSIYENINKIKIQFDFYNIEYEYEKILKIEKELENIEIKISNFANNLKQINYNLENLQKDFNEYEKIITKNETLLNEKNSNLKEKKVELNKNKYEKNFREVLKEIENKIDFIINQEKIEQNKYENISLEKNKIQLEFKKVLTEKEINEKNYIEKTKNIQKMLKETGFLEEEILEKALPKEKEEYREEKIVSYEEKTNNCKINLQNIKNEFFEFNKTNVEDLNLSHFKNLLSNILNQKRFFEEEKENNIKNIAELKIKIENGKKALEKIKILQEKRIKIQKKYDILEELFKLNQGGIFVEYVANRQLKQIVFDASKRLEIMSQNKYSLELINNEFTIKDNYNGGILRSTRSLSGGEVFMASLSLALSLSSKVQLKNKSPLEVFFLDEGFGTLDNNLLDTVITTLEQLQNENIDVGIITHVEEIKNRVFSKITVENKIQGAKIIF